MMCVLVLYYNYSYMTLKVYLHINFLLGQREAAALQGVPGESTQHIHTLAVHGITWADTCHTNKAETGDGKMISIQSQILCPQPHLPSWKNQKRMGLQPKPYSF